MRQDSSAIGWKQEDEEWIALAQSNDFRMFFIMPYTLEYLCLLYTSDAADE